MKNNSRKKKKENRPFGKILTSLLKEKKCTISKAAKAAGVSASTISDWCNGSSPEDYIAVMKLAHFLQVSFSYLLTGSDDTRQSPPAINEVFEDDGTFFDGYAHIIIKKLKPK